MRVRSIKQCWFEREVYFGGAEGSWGLAHLVGLLPYQDSSWHSEVKKLLGRAYCVAGVISTEVESEM